MKNFYKEDNQDNPAIVYSETQPEGFTVVGVEESKLLLLNNELRLIKQRKIDGISAYQSALASMRLERLENLIDHSTYSTFVYIPMEAIVNAVNKGSWIDAYDFINEVVSNQYLSEIKLTEFRQIISNYIVNSGNYAEFAASSIDEDGYII